MDIFLNTELEIDLKLNSMLKINEAAKDYSKSKSSAEVFRCAHETDFKAGVEFAQRWISVEEELPENGDFVLVKTDNGCVTTAYLHGIKSGFVTYGEDAYIVFGVITHWRPIELK